MFDAACAGCARTKQCWPNSSNTDALPPTPAWRRYAETIVQPWRASIDDLSSAQLGLQLSYLPPQGHRLCQPRSGVAREASTLSTPGTNRSLERSADPISS